MSSFEITLLVLAAAGLLYWIIQLAGMMLVVAKVPLLERSTDPQPAEWPRVSLIIPACNEAESLLEATRSRLREDYPNLEIILINDRSTDATGKIVDQLAAEDTRVRTVHITDLPDGWLGKVHALHTGARMATGVWLLYSDADVHQQPDTLRRVIAFAEHRGFDHVGALPKIWSSSFLLDMAMANFVRQLCFGGRIWDMPNPNSSAVMGVGAFNLVRRSTLNRTPGFEHLRLTILDDIALGQMLKQHGARGTMLNARRHVGLYFYRSIGEALRGLEKSALAPFSFRWGRMILVMGGVIALECSPLLGFWPGTSWWLKGTCIASGAIALAANLLINGFVHRPLLSAIFIPITNLFGTWAFLRAAILISWRGGCLWRGKLYPLALLRKENRFAWI